MNFIFIYMIEQEDGIKIYKDMLDVMNQIISKQDNIDIEHDKLFKNTKLIKTNKNIKNGNYYNVDKYGLLYRKNDFMKTKSIYGWKNNEYGEPINIHIDESLIQMNDPDIRKIMLQKLYKINKTAFGQKGKYREAYNELELEL